TRFENENRRLKSENESLFEMKNELLTQRNSLSDKIKLLKKSSKYLNSPYKENFYKFDPRYEMSFSNTNMNLLESTVKNKEDNVPFNQERILNETKTMEKTPKITNFKLERVEYSDKSNSSENSEESQSESETSTSPSSSETESSSSSTSSSRESTRDRKSKKEKKKDKNKKLEKRKSRSKYVDKTKTCHKGISSLKINTTIKEFHGTDKERVEDWLYTVDRASSFLRDVALHNFQALEKTKKAISWSDFCEHMTKKYKPTDHEFKLREKLKNLKANRDISSYLNEFRILMNQISSMDETDKISYFTDGLSGLTSGYVKFCKPKTLEEAIEVAENYEAFKMSENPKTSDIFFASSKSGFKDKSNYSKNAMTVEDLTKTNDLLKHTGFILDKVVEVVFDTGASSSIIGLNTDKKLGLNILASDKSINTADGSTNKVIGVTEEIELKVEESVANLSLIITNVSHIEVLLGLDWFDQTEVVLDPARRILKIPGKNIKLLRA
ncbi:hypothetical protein BpHYR1_022305, partial [Brachionus plicatilis]